MTQPTPEQEQKWRDDLRLGIAAQLQQHDEVLSLDATKCYVPDFNSLTERAKTNYLNNAIFNRRVDSIYHGVIQILQAARAIDAQRIAYLDNEANRNADLNNKQAQRIAELEAELKIQDDANEILSRKVAELESQVRNLNSRIKDKDNSIARLNAELARWNAPIDFREFRIEMHTELNSKHWKICDRVDARSLDLASSPEKLVADVCTRMFLNLAAAKRKGE